ncbi:MAG TPA: GreA/GreB family elongation factor [Prolixibacteraceae bacterium]|nr:GreA/GreB family elongation factor [Prolixibacteraceae bacterium]HPR60672.1 GreA/GreB family elongation factor [Prolixibacteraceae bacterium]
MNNIIKITEKDYIHLCNLIKNEKAANKVEAESISYLGAEIKRAKKVISNKKAYNFVTMNSRVEFTDISTNNSLEVKLVSPSEADFKKKYVSIFSSLGSALLGYSVDSEIVYKAPSGERKIKINNITYPDENN